MGWCGVLVLLSACAGFELPPPSAHYARVAAERDRTDTPAPIPRQEEDLVDGFGAPRTDLSARRTSASGGWERDTYGNLLPKTVHRGGQEITIGEPDYLRQSWLENDRMRDPGMDVCPLALAFDDGPVTFEAAPGSFDWGGPHRCEGADWPTDSVPWLVLDLDASGTIDSGAELFGTGTKLGEGRFARHGFEALAQYDADGDGAITPADPIWASLRLWRDRDRDRRSSAAELQPLDEAGVLRLDLGFERRFECGPDGNCVGERSAVELRGGEARLLDLYLKCR